MAEMNLNTKKPISSYTMSILFFAVVVVATILMFLYNSFLSWQVEELESKISWIEISIKAVEQDESLQIYSLLELNKEAISKYENMNRITEFINHMNTIKWKYNLDIKWFDLKNWEIETLIRSSSDNEWIAYEKTKEFISNYRVDELAMFDLLFVNSFTWMDDMKFKVNFKIK